MSEGCFSSIVHKDFHEAMVAKKDAEIERRIEEAGR